MGNTQNNKTKKILTLEQLANFCETHNMLNFSSKDTGYKLAVQIPATFEEEEVASDKDMLYCTVKVCHTLLNRNKSYISEENMKKAMPSLKYRPFLATIHQLDSGEWDFHSHDMNIIENEDGECEYEYIEKQVGAFTADEPYLEYDEQQDKTYVIARVAIPENYTRTADIIRNRKGSKVSCELAIESMEYNAKEKYLELKDFYFTGCTALGYEKDGTEIGEGMLGSRVDIEDFSEQNNSMFSFISEEEHTKLIDTLSKLNDTLEKFNINNDSKESVKNYGKEDEHLNEVNMKNEEVVEEVTEKETSENADEVVETVENSSEENADESTTETVEETPEVVETETESEEEVGETSEEEETEEVEEDKTPVATEEEACKPKKKKCEKMSRTYEISHEDLRYALYELLAPYEEEDYFYIEAVYDDYFCYSGWCTGNIYGQKYIKDGDNVAFDGERYALHRELLTDSEYAELQTMRSNYAAISEKLSAYESAELKSQKDAVLADEAYAEFTETDEFKSIIENVDNYSVDELRNACDLAFAKLVKANKNFSLKSDQNDVERKTNKLSFALNVEEEYEPYGDYFKSIN